MYSGTSIYEVPMTGEICSLYRGFESSLYRKPRYNEFVEKQPKCSLYRGIANNCF